jgi:MOSC domain-containing protein YiiM
VHLLHAELFSELQDKGFQVRAGDLGENITTLHLDILALPTGTRLVFGDQAIVEVTGLRSPCVQMDRFRPGLMAAVLDRDEKGGLVRKAGIMNIVIQSGEVRSGDGIQVLLPLPPHRPLKVV